MAQIISMQNPFLFAVWYLAYCFFYYVVTRAILKSKNIPSAVSCWILSLLYLIAKYSDNISYFILTPAIIGVIIYSILNKKQAFRYIASVVFANVLLFLAGLTFGIMIVFLLGDNYASYYENLQPYQDYLIVYLSGIILLCSTGLFFSGLIKLIKSKEKSFLKQQNKYVFFLWLPMTHTITFLFFMLLFAEEPTKFENLTKFAACFALIIFIFDFITFFVIEKYENLEIQNKLYEQQIVKSELEYQKAVMLNENEEKIGKFRHDLNNVLLLVKGYIEIGNNEKALKLLEDTTDDLNTVKGVPICSSPALNTILKIKKEQANSQGLYMDININETSPVKISEYDLCKIVGNITDNCIEAALSEKDKNIIVNIDINDEKIKINTKNACTKKNIKKVKRENRGHGKNILNEIAKKYHGNCFFTQKEDNYYMEIEIENITL